MNELLLIVVCLVVFITSQFLLTRVKQPALTYIRVISALILLVLVLFFAAEGRWSAKLVLVVLAIFGMIRALAEYRKSPTSSGTDHLTS